MDNTSAAGPVDYELRLIATESATGYFGSVPREDLGFDRMLAHARTHPNDEFMRRHLLRKIGAWAEKHLKEHLATIDPQDGFLRVLPWEASQLRSDSGQWRRHFPKKILKPLAGLSPQVALKSHLLKDRGLHRKWIGLFRENIQAHRLLPDPATVEWRAPFGEKKINGRLEPRLTLKALFEKSPPVSGAADTGRMTPEEVHALALARLKEAGVVIGSEMRHTTFS